MKPIVNAEGIQRTLAQTITGYDIVLKEILMNAVRAINSKNLPYQEGVIDLTYASGSGLVTITNNGVPILNWHAVIDAGSTDWNEEVTEKQNPFGLGGSSSLAATKGIITIESYGETMTFLAEDLAAGNDLGEVKPTDHTPLAEVSFSFYISKDYRDHKMKELFDHMPSNIRYVFNNREIEPTIPTHCVPLINKETQPLGFLKITRGFDNVCAVEGNMPLTYQNFSTDVQGGKYITGTGYVIALNEKEFTANIPTRSKIIHYEEREEELRTALYKALRAIALQEPVSTLLGCYSLLKVIDSTDLLDGVDLLPPNRCYTPTAPDDVMCGEPASNLFGPPVDCGPVKKSDEHLYEVKNLTPSPETLPAFLAALRNGGSVAIGHGTPLEDYAPQFDLLFLKHPTLQSLNTPAELWAGAIGFINTIKDPDLPRFHLSCDQLVLYDAPYTLYVNLHKLTPLKASGVLDFLLMADDYDYDYGGHKDQAEEDAANIVQALSAVITEDQLKISINFTEELGQAIDRLTRSTPTTFLPRCMRGESFNLTVTDQGVFTVTLNEEDPHV